MDDARIGAITDESILSYISKECLQRLNYMHSFINISHNKDVKPENMRINNFERRIREKEYDFSSDIFLSLLELCILVLSIALVGSKVERTWLLECFIWAHQR